MGGFLASHLDNPTRIVAQIGPGPKARHRPGSLDLDGDYARAWAKENSLRIVGHWHTHPDDGSVPSPDDLQAWASGCALRQGNPFVGIIAVRGELGFTTPKLHGWITHRKPGRYVCEQLRLLEE